MKTKCTRYVHLYDAVQLQSWLEDQARAGWRLEDAGGGNTYGVFPCFAHFVRGDGAVRYRLVPMRTEGGGIMVANIPEPGRDMQELYEGLGWQYLCNLRGYYVFSAGAPSAPEPFTDTSTACDALESVVRMTWRGLCSYLVCCALYLSDMMLQWELRGWWGRWPALLFNLLVALLYLRRYLVARKHLKRAEQGEPEDCGAYRDVWYLRWGDLLLTLMPWLLLLAPLAALWGRVIGEHHIYRP